MLKRLFLSLFITCVCVFLFSYFKIIVFNDISIEPMDTSVKKYPQGVYLVSYADGDEVFYQNQNALTLSALNKGVDFYFQYRRHHIDTAFAEKYKDILSQKTGAGLWLWKPWVILKTLESVPENAIVVYMDTGFTITHNLNNLLKKTDENDITVIHYPTDVYGHLDQIVSQKVLSFFDMSREDAKKTVYTMAGFMILKNTPRSRSFIKKWLELCCQKKFIQPEGLNPGDPHSYDQTLFNMTRLKWFSHVNSISEDELLEYVCWHHRKKDRKELSLIHYMKKKISYLEKICLNAYGLRHFRYWLAHSFT